MRKIKIIADDKETLTAIGPDDAEDFWERVYDIAVDYSVSHNHVVVKDLDNQELIIEFTKERISP